MHSDRKRGETKDVLHIKRQPKSACGEAHKSKEDYHIDLHYVSK